MGYERIDQSRIDLGEQKAEDFIVELTGPVEIRELASVHVEIGNPIRALVLAVYRVGQLAFFPQAADQNFAAMIFDGLLYRSGDSAGIAVEFVAVKQEKTVVALHSH